MRDVDKVLVGGLVFILNSFDRYVFGFQFHYSACVSEIRPVGRWRYPPIAKDQPLIG